MVHKRIRRTKTTSVMKFGMYIIVWLLHLILKIYLCSGWSTEIRCWVGTNNFARSSQDQRSSSYYMDWIVGSDACSVATKNRFGWTRRTSCKNWWMAFSIWENVRCKCLSFRKYQILVSKFVSPYYCFVLLLFIPPASCSTPTIIFTIPPNILLSKILTSCMFY